VKISIKIHHDKMWKDFFLHQIYILIKENKWKWQSLLALIALAGGVLSPVIGTVLNLMVWFIPVSHLRTLLYETSMVFFAVTLPLLALGSHCLDLLEKKSSVISSL
jgi:hypothetical protein